MKFQSIRATVGACCFTLFSPVVLAADAGSVVLDEIGVANLGIQTVVAEEAPFTETVFTLGRIESVPNRSGSVSSRISGRLVELGVAQGDVVSKGQIVAKVESRQPGDPPPVIPLTSPLQGIVMHADSKLGDPVEPEKAIVEIVDLSEVYAISQIPEYQAGNVKLGTKAKLRIPAMGDKEFEVSMLRFGTSADQQNGTIDAIFLLPNKDLAIRPGMRVEFDVVLSHRENILSVPKDALQGNPSNRHVWVKDFTVKNAFVKAPVQLGETSGDRVEILSGIFPGDEVVTRGSYALGFAGGGGGVSLKEALDAAHGHKHNEDGSEMTPEQAAAEAAGGSGGDAHDHGEHAGEAKGISTRELGFMVATGFLGLLVLVMGAMQWKAKNNP